MVKNLDQELAEAAGLDDAVIDGTSNESGTSVNSPAPADSDPAGAVVAEAVRRQPGKEAPQRNIGLLAMLLVMVAGVVALFTFGFKEAAIYSMPLDDFMTNIEQHRERRVRVEGELVPGSLVKRDKPCEFRFRMKALDAKKGAPDIEVRYAQCIVPDTFRDVPQGGVQVTAEGTLTSGEGGHFDATTIMAKCSSKYDAETHTLAPDA